MKQYLALINTNLSVYEDVKEKENVEHTSGRDLISVIKLLLFLLN
jgi:hypothetical protein